MMRFILWAVMAALAVAAFGWWRGFQFVAFVTIMVGFVIVEERGTWTV